MHIAPFSTYLLVHLANPISVGFFYVLPFSRVAICVDATYFQCFTGYLVFCVLKLRTSLALLSGTCLFSVLYYAI